MAPQFINMFNLVGAEFTKTRRLPSLSPQIKAIITVVGMLAVTGGLGAVAVFTSYSFVSLIAMGAIYGIVLSYPLTRFFAPKVQSLLAAFFGGISLGNIGSQEATVRSWIIALAKWIKQLVVSANPPERLTDAIVYSIWTTIVVALAIVAANVYFARQSTNSVGSEVRPTQPPQPPAPQGQAAGAHGI